MLFDAVVPVLLAPTWTFSGVPSTLAHTQEILCYIDGLTLNDETPGMQGT